MAVIQVEIKDCTKCPEFAYTADEGAFCEKVGVDQMIKDDTYAQFNRDFQSGNWHVPKWCPLKT